MAAILAASMGKKTLNPQLALSPIPRQMLRNNSILNVAEWETDVNESMKYNHLSFHYINIKPIMAFDD